MFALANSVDPDEMPHYAAFHLGLHCLQKKYRFREGLNAHAILSRGARSKFWSEP